MHIYLIDTENVFFRGFAGIGQLGATDVVYALYSEALNNSKADGSLALELGASKANFVKEKLEPKGKNYLDMQLATIAGQAMEQYKDAEVVIISKDRDYQAVLDYWTKQGRKISMAESIEVYLNPQKKTAKTVAKIEEAYIRQTLAPEAISKENDSMKAQAQTMKEKNTSTTQKAQSNQQAPTIKETKSPDIEAYREQVAKILTDLVPGKSKASITKYSKSIAKLQDKKGLKNYCTTTFGDSAKNHFKVYSRICQVFPY